MTIEDLNGVLVWDAGGRGSVRAAASSDQHRTCQHKILLLGRSLALPLALLPLALALITALLTASTATAQNDGRANNDKNLKKQISISWQDVHLRDALLNLAASQEVPIFLDRRVDPGQKLDFKANETAIAEIIYQVADQTDCGVCWLGEVAYVGPREEVARLVVLRQQLLGKIRQLSNARKRRFLASAAFRIPRLGQPNELLVKQLRNLGVENSNGQLPHDLWPEYQIQSMRAIDRIIVLVFGFSRWPEFTSNQEFALIETPEVGESEIRLRVGSAERRNILARINAEFPNAGIHADKNYLVARADPIELYHIRRTVARIEFEGGKNTGGTKVVTLRVKGSIGQALKTAASGLSAELQFDPSLRSILLQQIDINVSKVTYEQLAELVLEGTGLTYSLRDGKLIVEQKEPE